MKKPKKKLREWKAWAVIDCKWGTLRDFSFEKCLLESNCTDCHVIKVIIKEVK